MMVDYCWSLQSRKREKLRKLQRRSRKNGNGRFVLYRKVVSKTSCQIWKSQLVITFKANNGNGKDDKAQELIVTMEVSDADHGLQLL